MASGPELSTAYSNYDKIFPDYNSKATIIGAIGLQNIKFARNIKDRAVHFNLYHKMNEGIHKPFVYDPKLRELLQFLKTNITKWNAFSKSLNVSKFICYRGLLTTIMKTPYESKNTWKIAVTLYKGNIYLCLRDTEEKKLQYQNISEYERQSTKGGYKFEHYVFSDSPDKEPTPDEPIDELAEFNCVYERQLNQHKIVFGAEIDGVACDVGNVKSPPVNASMDTAIQYLSKLEFVEAKTNLLFETHRGVFTTFRRFKSGGWWCQSFLVGIKRIICGLKTKSGIVEKVKIFTLDEIKELSEWNFDVCINFLDAFLTYVKECLSYVITRDFGEAALNNIQHLDLVTLTLEWRPRTNVVMTNSWNNTDDVILPKWYINAFDERLCDNDEREDSNEGRSLKRGADTSNKRSYDHQKGSIKKSRVSL